MILNPKTNKLIEYPTNINHTYYFGSKTPTNNNYNLNSIIQFRPTSKPKPKQTKVILRAERSYFTVKFMRPQRDNNGRVFVSVAAKKPQHHIKLAEYIKQRGHLQWQWRPSIVCCTFHRDK